MSSPSTTQPDLPTSPASCGLLTSHRVLEFAGPDAAAFLQGYLTCDTDNLSARNALPGAFTNLKGRVVANGWVWGNTSEVRILISAELTGTVSEFLKMYLNFAKTRLTVAPHAPTISLNPILADAVQLGNGKVLCATGFAQQTSPLSVTEDLSPGWLAHSISHKEVLVTAATSGTLLPQMLGLTDLGAVSFDKGCYLGQEVVARAQHRGEVKRRLRHIEYSAHQPLAAGATLQDSSGKRVAVVINATAYTSDEAAAEPLQNTALIVTAVDVLEGLLWDYAGTPVQLT